MRTRHDKIFLVLTGFLAAAATACSKDTITPEPTQSQNPNIGPIPAAGTGLPPATGGAAAVGGRATGSAGAVSSGAGGKAGAGAAGAAGTLAAAGSSGGSAAAGSGGSSSGGAVVPTSGAYFSSGRLHGYAFTMAIGTGSTISPMDFSTLAAGQPHCAMGAVGPDPAYKGVALLGVYLNQEQTVGAPQMTLTPMGAGLNVEVKNAGSSALRLQLEAPAADAKGPWCAPITGTGGFIPWASFNTACWEGGMGTAYANEPISAAELLVPGGMTDPVMFDICLNSLAEADGAPAGGAGGNGGSTAPAAGSGGSAAGGGAGSSGGEAGSGPLDPGNSTGSGTLVDKYDIGMVTRDGRNYVVQNNVWGADATQEIKYNGTTYEITKQTGKNVASGPNAGAPVSYPSVFIGSNNNRTTAGSNLPKQVSALKSVKTAWSNNAGSAIPGTYNAAYDVWFSTGANGDPAAPSGGYLMVWYYKPSDAQPIGSKMDSGVTVAGVPGTWDVWIGPNDGKPVISYVRTSQTNSLEYDLNAFIKDAVKRPGAIQSSWYLTNVFAGFEIWNGGVGLKTTAFYAIVE